MKRSIGSLAIVGAAVLALVLGACSGDDDDNDTSSATTTASTAAAPTTAAVDRPDGSVADMSEEIEGANAPYLASAEPVTLADGYEEHEYVAAGTATSYQPEGELTGDGMWNFAPDTTADYRTRVLVRRPSNPEDFSGTVIVEWLNVSGGVDTGAEYSTAQAEFERSGHAWVGVSAQAIGVEGGPVAVKVDVAGAEDAGKGLKTLDPERYASLSHPGDLFSYDIFTQVARALRQGEGLGDLQLQHLVATGQSQSAFAMVTYINGVQPLTKQFDGFFVHSRGAPGMGLPEAGQPADIQGSLAGSGTTLRTDTDVPIFVLQTESDIVGVFASAKVRQPDTDTFRQWEVPGTSHADRHIVGPRADELDCGVPINDGPLYVVAMAGWRHFADWVAGGDPPPTVPVIELNADASDAQRDANGIALGGVRTPPVDVPTRVLTREPGPNPSVICILLGSTQPMTAEQLAALYSSQAEFREQYDASVDEAIDAGFVLEEDREAIESFAHPELVSG